MSIRRLDELLDRPPLRPWSGGGKIPWHEPGFSARMLREHLTQAHDRASRRFETIDRHVAWIHRAALAERPGRVLDLGCGPGLYTSRLARRGHACVGFDISPASIEHARGEAQRERLDCTYHRASVLEADLGEGFDAALMLFGEINAFPPVQAASLLVRAAAALAPGGRLVLEVHDEAFVRAWGEGTGGGASEWSVHAQSVFAEAPHLRLCERAFHPEAGAATRRDWIVDLASGGVTEYTSTLQAHDESTLRGLLEEAGLDGLERVDSLTGDPARAEPGLYVLVGQRVDD